MKTSASSWSCHRLFAQKKMDLFGWLDECARLELDGVELLEDHIPSTEGSFLRRVKKACTDRFLTIAMVSAGGHLTTSDDAQRRRDVEEIGKWMDAALYLGAPLVRFFCGSGSELEAGGKPLYAKVLAAMKEVAALGEQRGIVAALENHGGTTADQLLSLRRDVNSPWFAFTLDVGNFPPASRVGPDTYTSIERCAPHAAIVHGQVLQRPRRRARRRLRLGPHPRHPAKRRIPRVSLRGVRGQKRG